MAEEAGTHILWKGYLKLSLVSCAVAVIPAATGTGAVPLNTLNAQTGHRVRRRYVDSVTGEPVDRDDQVMGYKVGKDRYVTLTDEDFDSIELEGTHTIDIRLFVPAEEIDQVWTDGSHYLVPDDPVAVEAYAVIREAMRAEGLVGIGRVVLHRRERRCVLAPRGKGMLITILRYPYETREDDPIFERIPDVDPPADMLDLAARLIEEKTGDWRPEDFPDRYTAALKDLVASKAEGTAPPEAPKGGGPAEVVNLMDALKASIAAEKKGTSSGKPAASRGSGKRGSDTKAAAPKGTASKKKARER